MLSSKLFYRLAVECGFNLAMDEIFLKALWKGVKTVFAGHRTEVLIKERRYTNVWTLDDFLRGRVLCLKFGLNLCIEYTIFSSDDSRKQHEEQMKSIIESDTSIYTERVKFKLTLSPM